jgi:hypothetical protein
MQICTAKKTLHICVNKRRKCASGYSYYMLQVVTQDMRLWNTHREHNVRIPYNQTDHLPIIAGELFLDGKLLQTAVRKTPRDVVVKYEQSRSVVSIAGDQSQASDIQISKPSDEDKRERENEQEQRVAETPGDACGDVLESEAKSVDEASLQGSARKKASSNKDGSDTGDAETGKASGKKKSRRSVESDKSRNKGKKRGDKAEEGSASARGESSVIKAFEKKPSALFGKGSSVTCYLDTDKDGGRLTFEVDGEDVGLCVPGVFELLGSDEVFPSVCLAPFDDTELMEKEEASVKDSEGGNDDEVDDDEEGKDEEQVRACGIAAAVSVFLYH